MSANPYSNLPSNRFWRSGVAEADPLTIRDLYQKKFVIAASDKIATAGSCFAQHISQHMRRRGYNVLDTEPPLPGMTEKTAQKFGYALYSARYGNVYTVRQLLQLLDDALNQRVRDEDMWENDGRYFDGLRPAVEPAGLGSQEEVRSQRFDHLRNVVRLIDETDIFVFTLGLTEAWVNRKSGTVYPVCPGVVAGTFDPALHAFHNFEYPEIYEDMLAVRELLKARRPDMRFLFTVSPVPLTATASDEHILVATTWSKSTLRSVCGSLARRFDDIDYFPSYEMIASPFSRSAFYAPNLRSVTTAGVEAVMRVFFAEHRLDSGAEEPIVTSAATPVAQAVDDDELICEEKLLEAFG